MRITQKYLKSILDYDPNTGVFIWKEARGSVRAGRIAGNRRPDGYIHIRIDKKFYKAHRLAWLYVHGKLPRSRIDHKDRDGSNNKFCNLRRATHSQNMANRKINKNTKSGFKGVSPRGDKFRAYINKNGVRYYLGDFPSVECAAAAYRRAALEKFGEFSYGGV